MSARHGPRTALVAGAGIGGLAGMVWTRDLDRAHRVAGRIRTGMVWVNCFFERELRAPFGGVGWSGIGREGGRWSRDFFSDPKAVVVLHDAR